LWSERSFNVKCQFESFAIILKVSNIFCFGPKLFWLFFWMTAKYTVSDKAFVCFKYIPVERWRKTAILCELNFELHSFSIYYKIHVLPVRNVIACSTWPTWKIKRLNKENDVSNFAIFIKCTCKCVFIN